LFTEYFKYFRNWQAVWSILW